MTQSGNRDCVNERNSFATSNNKHLKMLGTYKKNFR